MKKIAIIGGSGEFGRVFAKIFKEHGFHVTITDIDVEKAKKVAKELGVDVKSNIEAAKESDIVIISVSINRTIEAIKEVAPHVREGSLLMDFTSVKIEPCRAMEKHAKKGVEVIGLHPMFGPRITSLEGQVFVVTPVRPKDIEKSHWWKGFLKPFLEKNKTRYIITTPEEHDRIMSVVQALTHFVYISVASTLKELNFNVKESRKYASPIYELMIDLIARIVGQNPWLYAYIQMMNPFAKHVHEVYLRKVKELKDIISRKDVERFVKIMGSSAKHIGDISTSMGRSDKAILALNQELKKLSNSIGKEVALKHIYSNKVHIGVVENVNPEFVSLKTKKGKIKLKISNIELLDEDELFRIKSQILPKETRDYSILIPESADEKYIAKLMKNIDKRILECKIIDVYRGKQIPEGYKSVTFRIRAFDFNFKKIDEFIKSLGYSIR